MPPNTSQYLPMPPNTWLCCNDCRKKKSTVTLCQGDLVLCPDCNEKRFPSHPKPKVPTAVATDHGYPIKLSTPQRMVNLLSSPLRTLNPAPIIRPVTCTDTCLVSIGNSKDGKAQECCLCGQSYHYICVGITRKQAVWFCTMCKSMPGKLRELTIKVESHSTLSPTPRPKQLSPQRRMLSTLSPTPSPNPLPPRLNPLPPRPNRPRPRIY